MAKCSTSPRDQLRTYFPSSYFVAINCARPGVRTPRDRIRLIITAFEARRNPFTPSGPWHLCRPGLGPATLSTSNASKALQNYRGTDLRSLLDCSLFFVVRIMTSWTSCSRLTSSCRSRNLPLMGEGGDYNRLSRRDCPLIQCLPRIHLEAISENCRSLETGNLTMLMRLMIVPTTGVRPFAPWINLTQPNIHIDQCGIFISSVLSLPLHLNPLLTDSLPSHHDGT